MNVGAVYIFRMKSTPMGFISFCVIGKVLSTNISDVVLAKVCNIHEVSAVDKTGRPNGETVHKVTTDTLMIDGESFLSCSAYDMKREVGHDEDILKFYNHALDQHKALKAGIHLPKGPQLTPSADIHSISSKNHEVQ